MAEFKGLIALIFVSVTLVTAWIRKVRMRRRIRRTVGLKPGSESELTSLSLWMQVDGIEHEQEARKPIEPR
jgi:hypothetical protein